MFEDVIKKMDNFSKYQRTAALTVFAVHKPRIFQKGIASDGSKIGNYVDGPYKEERRRRGRETGFVNLDMFGSMKKDYQITKPGAETIGFGFDSKVESDKAEFNEERYKKDIFSLTKDESDLYMRTLDKLIFENK